MTDRDETGSPTEGLLRARYIAGYQDGQRDALRRVRETLRAMADLYTSWGETGRAAEFTKLANGWED